MRHAHHPRSHLPTRLGHLEKQVVLEHALHGHHQQVPQGEPPVVCSLGTFLGGSEDQVNEMRQRQVWIFPEPEASYLPRRNKEKGMPGTPWGEGWSMTQPEGCLGWGSSTRQLSEAGEGEGRSGGVPTVRTEARGRAHTSLIVSAPSASTRHTGPGWALVQDGDSV